MQRLENVPLYLMSFLLDRLSENDSLWRRKLLEELQWVTHGTQKYLKREFQLNYLGINKKINVLTTLDEWEMKDVSIDLSNKDRTAFSEVF